MGVRIARRRCSSPSNRIRLAGSKRIHGCIRAEAEVTKKYTAEQAMADAKRRIDKEMGRSKKKPVCTCTNHLGKPKQQFKTKDAALAIIARHHMWTGKSYHVYQCPTSNRFHIAGDGQFKKPRRKT
jgi:hypothetical protein